eukprot:1121160-Amphidinium_carterae.1
MADRLNWTPTPEGWRQGDPYFLLMPTTKSSGILACTCAVADTRPDFQGLDSSLATQALRQLKLDGQSQKHNVRMTLNVALGGVWHEAHVHAEFGVGDLSVRCGEVFEDLEHIVHHCPASNAKRRQVVLPASALEVPPCIKLHGLLPAKGRW